MRHRKYLYDFVIQIILIFAVMHLFRTIPDRLQASFWAGALFVLLPMSMMGREWIFGRFNNRMWWWAVLQFWILFALPIFIMRVMHPHVSLNEVSLGPIPMSLWHKVSNGSYMLWMLVTLWSWWSYRKTKSPSQT